MKILNALPEFDEQDIKDIELLNRWILNSRSIRESPGMSRILEDTIQRLLKDDNNKYTGSIYRCTYFGADKAEALFDKGTTTLNKYPAYSFASDPSVAYEWYESSKANHTKAVIETEGEGLDLYKCLGNIVERLASRIYASNNAAILSEVESAKEKENPDNESRVTLRAFIRWLSNQPSGTPAKQMFQSLPRTLKEEVHWHLNEAEIIIPRGLRIKSTDVKEIDPDDELIEKAKANSNLASALINYSDAAKKIEDVPRKQEGKKSKLKDKDKSEDDSKHKDKKKEDKKKKPKVLDYDAGKDDKDEKDEKKGKHKKPGKWFFELTRKQRKKYIEKHDKSEYKKWIDKDLP